MNIRLLITHPGSSHRDEWLGCALVLGQLLRQGQAYQELPPIVRRQPTAEDLTDPSVWVLDIGGEHAPDKGNFDHHQFSMEETIRHPRCTFTLLLDHFGLLDELTELLPWVAFSAATDCLGREKASHAIGIPSEAVPSLESPIESGMITQFARMDNLTTGEPLHLVMAETGRHILGQAKRLRQRLALLEQESREITLQPCRVLLVDLPDLPAPQMGLFQFRQRQLDQGHDVGAMILPDARGPGFILVRTHDAAPMDFRKLRGEPEVGFVHASGFLVQLTSRVDSGRLKILLDQALIREAEDHED